MFFEKDKSPYIWDVSTMHISNINRFEISFGDLPIFHICYDGEKLIIFNRIDGSRDGGRDFSIDFFEKKFVRLTNNQRMRIINYLGTIDFCSWKTRDYIRELYEENATGFCIYNSFWCKFNNREYFQCLSPRLDSLDSFDQLVEFLKGFCDSSYFMPYKDESQSDVKNNSSAEIPIITDADANSFANRNLIGRLMSMFLEELLIKDIS